MNPHNEWINEWMNECIYLCVKVKHSNTECTKIQITHQKQPKRTFKTSGKHQNTKHDTTVKPSKRRYSAFQLLSTQVSWRPCQLPTPSPSTNPPWLKFSINSSQPARPEFGAVRSPPGLTRSAGRGGVEPVSTREDTGGLDRLQTIPPGSGPLVKCTNSIVLRNGTLGSEHHCARRPAVALMGHLQRPPRPRTKGPLPGPAPLHGQWLLVCIHHQGAWRSEGHR